MGALRIGTRHVVRACQHHRVDELIFISTPSIYFTGRDRFDITEDEPLPPEPATAYARTKLQAERELLAETDRGPKVIILRPRAVFGPHDATIIPRILRLGNEQRFPLIGDGRAVIDITHVDNLVDAVGCCLRAEPEAWNAAYNVSNGEPIPIRDWFARILEIHGRPFHPRTVSPAIAKAMGTALELMSRLPLGPKQPAFTRFSVGYMATSMTMSIERARERLGFVPNISNEAGFGRYAEWVARGGTSGDQRAASRTFVE